MEEIHEWLKGKKDFKQGLLLYSKYGPFKSVHSTLSRIGENSMTRSALEDHLRRVMNSSPVSAKAEIPAQAGDKPQAARPSAHEPQKFDASALRSKANKIYQELAVLHSRLLVIKEVAERKEVMKRFHARHSEWCEAMYKCDYFGEHGKLPPLLKPQKKVTKAKELSGSEHTELTNLRSKVTRARNEQIPAYEAKLKKKEDKKIRAKLESRKKELAEWMKRIEELENGNDGTA